MNRRSFLHLSQYSTHHPIPFNKPNLDMSDDRPPSGDQLNDQNDQRYYEQQMNKTSRRRDETTAAITQDNHDFRVEGSAVIHSSHYEIGALVGIKVGASCCVSGRPGTKRHRAW